MTTSSAGAQAIALDETVLFVPNTAHVLDATRIVARVDAWVFELERRPGLTLALAKHLGLDLDALEDAERQRFFARTQLFRVDSERGRDLSVRFGAGATHPLPTTRSDGRSHARVVVAATTPLFATPLPFELDLPRDERRFEGYALLVPEHGLSVISDIDDTIKHTEVRDRREMLLNTFAREFVAVPDMAARYRELLALQPATAFHYVSAGPIQLYPALAPFLLEAGFPQGSMHLRESTSIKTVIPRHGDSFSHKLSVIGKLLRDFPQRQFLLIGDSGEADPEIYAQVAREHLDRIAHIYIRDVSDEPADTPRYRKTFDGIPPERWSVFTTPPAFAALPQ